MEMNTLIILQLTPTPLTKNENAFALKIGEIRNLLLNQKLKVNCIESVMLKQMHFYYRAEMNNEER